MVLVQVVLVGVGMGAFYDCTLSKEAKAEQVEERTETGPERQQAGAEARPEALICRHRFVFQSSQEVPAHLATAH